MEKKEIQFKPLNEGLGFHPFADGLPYAPQSPSQRLAARGTGAIAAGKPVFVTPSTSPTIERIKKELESLDSLSLTHVPKRPEIFEPIQSLQVKNISERERPTPTPLSVELTKTSGKNFFYLVQRVFAFLIDSIFNISVCATILSTALINTDSEKLGLITPGILLTVATFLFFCNWALIAGQEMAFGTSLGKRIFGLKIEGSGSQVFWRSVFFIPGFLFSGLGLCVSLFDPEKRCWHDLASGVQPEKMFL